MNNLRNSEEQLAKLKQFGWVVKGNRRATPTQEKGKKQISRCKKEESHFKKPSLQV